jgi:hypothetical protein
MVTALAMFKTFDVWKVRRPIKEERIRAAT